MSAPRSRLPTRRNVAIAAMLVRKACEAGVTTPALLRATIHFLVRAEDHPRLAGEVFIR